MFSKTGTITAGNASTINDGAGMALLAGAAAVSRHGLQPAARMVASATHSIHPDKFAEAPVDAIRKCCVKAKLRDGRHRPVRNQRSLLPPCPWWRSNS